MKKLLLILFISQWSLLAFSQIAVYDGFEEFKHRLQPHGDTTYVVNFWATWCAPCVAELPAFEQLNEQYRGQKVKVLLVSLDFPRHIERALIPFIKKNSIQSEVVVLDDPDSNSWIDKISPDWSGAIPATLIFNQNKKAFYEQSFTYEELYKVCEQIRKSLNN